MTKFKINGQPGTPRARPHRPPSPVPRPPSPVPRALRPPSGPPPPLLSASLASGAEGTRTAVVGRGLRGRRSTAVATVMARGTSCVCGAVTWTRAMAGVTTRGEVVMAPPPVSPILSRVVAVHPSRRRSGSAGHPTKQVEVMDSERKILEEKTWRNASTPLGFLVWCHTPRRARRRRCSPRPPSGPPPPLLSASLASGAEGTRTAVVGRGLRGRRGTAVATVMARGTSCVCGAVTWTIFGFRV